MSSFASDKKKGQTGLSRSQSLPSSSSHEENQTGLKRSQSFPSSSSCNETKRIRSDGLSEDTILFEKECQSPDLMGLNIPQFGQDMSQQGFTLTEYGKCYGYSDDEDSNELPGGHSESSGSNPIQPTDSAITLPQRTEFTPLTPLQDLK